jgi:hypothetical protein
VAQNRYRDEHLQKSLEENQVAQHKIKIDTGMNTCKNLKENQVTQHKIKL